jgi:NAD+ synthase (glutamine-hydrolysing)
MKIALAQLNFHIGNFEVNTGKIIEYIKKAESENADLIIFPELAVSGYPPRDFLEFDDFVNKCQIEIKKIAAECTQITAILGAPSINPEPKGKHLFNSAFVLSKGKVQDIRHKSLLPNYDIFDEYRYFEPNRKFEIVQINEFKIALTICEDLWNISDDPLYVVNPMDELMPQQPDMIVNIAASPFNFRQAEIRREILVKNARTYQLPLFYVNHVGAQTELMFDGGSMVLDSEGNLAEELNFFKEDFKIVDFEKVATYKMPIIEPQKISEISRIHDALVMGIQDYFRKLGFKKAIVGLSGGIDSAVTLVLASEALGAENVKALLLPSQFSSDHSISDAEKLAKNIGVSHEIIPIQKAYEAFENTLEPFFSGLPFNIAEENIQARIRAVLLMAFSNKFGYILLNTSNKSEAAVGYGTLYGDMCGGLAVLGDLYKTQVYDLAALINSSTEIIPQNSIIKPPSAELRPNQKDQDSLPEYEILDKILFQYIELCKGPDEIIAMGFDKITVHKILKMVNTNEWKRYQTPPILRVSSKAFGSGRRMPIEGKYLG